MKKFMFYLLLSTLLINLVGCGDSDDATVNVDSTPTAGVAALALNTAINENFPNLENAAKSNLIDLGCDSYNTAKELDSCVTLNGGTFERTFDFDPASIFFGQKFLDEIGDIVGAGADVVIGSGGSMSVPYLTDVSGSTLTATVDASFAVTADKTVTINDFTVVFHNLQGGYSADTIVTTFDVKVYMTSDTSGNPSMYARFALYGNITNSDNFYITFARVEYESDTDTPPAGTLEFSSNTTPTGYKLNRGHLSLSVAGGTATYRASSHHNHEDGGVDKDDYFSLIMAGDFNTFLLRKHAKQVEDGTPSGESEQFWVVSYNSTNATLSTLFTTADDNDSYSSDASLADSLSTLLSGDAPHTGTVTPGMTSWVQPSNMYLFTDATEGLPTNMAILSNSWGD